MFGNGEGTGGSDPVEIQGQPPVETDDEPVFDQATPSQDLISLILQATALPQNCDTMFLAVTGYNPVRSYERPPQVARSLSATLSRLAGDNSLVQRLFVALANQANFIDMACELKRQTDQGIQGGGFSIWQQLVGAIFKYTRDPSFYFDRLYIMQNQFVERGGVSREQAIRNSKSRLLSTPGVPPGIDINEISWDTLSFKTPPMGIEYFCQLNPQMIDNLNSESYAVIIQVQNDIEQLIRIALADGRSKNSTQADPLIDDYTVFLEQRVASRMDIMQNPPLEGVGDNILIQYVEKFTDIFIAGLIPGTISPSKVIACQDVVSGTELRGAIITLSEEQMLQKIDTIANNNVKASAKLAAQTTGQLASRWTVKQQTSINQARAIDQTLAQGLKALHEQPYDDQRELGQQVAGGANDLRDQLDMQTQGAVVRLTVEKREMLKQHVSKLLACLRVRLDALQSSKYELVTNEEITHLEICKQLAEYVDPDSQKLLSQLPMALQKSFIDGHNKVKMYDLQLSEDTILSVEYQVMGKAQVILKAIPFFDADMQENQNYFKSLIDCIYLSLCEHNRLRIESDERYSRRLAIFGAMKL